MNLERLEQRKELDEIFELVCSQRRRLPFKLRICPDLQFHYIDDSFTRATVTKSQLVHPSRVEPFLKEGRDDAIQSFDENEAPPREAYLLRVLRSGFEGEDLDGRVAEENRSDPIAVVEEGREGLSILLEHDGEGGDVKGFDGGKETKGSLAASRQVVEVEGVDLNVEGPTITENLLKEDLRVVVSSVEAAGNDDGMFPNSLLDRVEPPTEATQIAGHGGEFSKGGVGEDRVLKGGSEAVDLTVGVDPKGESSEVLEE